MRGGLLLAAVIAVAATASVLVFRPDSSGGPSPPPPLPAASPDLLRMTVDVSDPGARRRVPRGFVGFSAEVPHAAVITGATEGTPNRVADGLFGEIRAAGSGGPTLRVGGSSVDQTWFNPDGRPRPPGIDFDVTPSYLEALREFRARNHSRLVLGLNLVSHDPSVATGYAGAARRVLGAHGVLAYEIGNEPDAYPGLERYTTPSGRHVPQRPADYSFADFLREYDARAALLRARVGPLPLAGPSACCAPEFVDGLGEFVRSQRERLAMVSVHEYFGSACVGRGDPGQPTIERLLGESAMRSVIGGLESAVAIARDAGKPLVVTETNSFACGGQPGVSDTFASALWAPEYMMRAAAAGVGGMYFHTFGEGYSPFDFSFDEARGWTGGARPLYYGMLLFARATANRASILIDPIARQRVREGADAVAFPTLDSRGTLRVLVLAQHSGRGGWVRLSVPGGADRARLTRMRAPGLSARAGVTVAGQAVPNDSATGRLTGAVRAPSLPRRGSGYRFRMPAPGAALLEVDVRR